MYEKELAAYFEAHKDEFLEDLAVLVAIPSVKTEPSGDCPYGRNTAKALSQSLSIAEKYDLYTENWENYVAIVQIEPGRRMLDILAHLDVVAPGDGWEVTKPYTMKISEGKVYGRGICDDKGPTILSLYALKALVEAGKLKDKRVRLIVGGDEESGAWVCMKRYRETEELPVCAFSPDGDYPATYAEKGIMHVTVSRDLDASVAPLTLEGGKTYNIVPAFAKAEFNGKTYESEGKAAHASRPELGINATRELCKKLAADGVDHPFVKLMKIADTEGWGIDFEDEPSGKLTLNPAISVVTPTHAEVKCDLRVPVTYKPEDVTAAINKTLAPLGFKAECDFVLGSLYVPKDSELVTTLQRVYKDCTGRDEQPISVGGGTYARTFENAVAFGPLLPGEENTNHKTNECWDYSNMLLTYQIIANVMEQL